LKETSVNDKENLEGWYNGQVWYKIWCLIKKDH